MKKTLESAGITQDLQRKLYTYGLLDTVTTVSGIGKRRLESLSDELENLYGDQKIPTACSWVYPLALTIAKQPLRAEDLCAPRAGNQPSILESLSPLNPADMRPINAVLNTALTSVEKSIIIKFYRNHIAPADIARQIGRAESEVYKLKNQALRKLRRPQYANVLNSIVFISTDDDAQPDN